MKKIIAALLLAVLITSAVAAEYEDATKVDPETVTIYYTGDTSMQLKERSFYLPFSIECTEGSMCGGGINSYLILTGGITADGGTRRVCAISNAVRKCDYNVKMNLIGGAEPTIQIKATTVAGTVEESDVITVKRYFGELEGRITSAPSRVIKGEKFDIGVEYDCLKAACFDVKLTASTWTTNAIPGHEELEIVGSNTYDCGSLDYENSCEHTFELMAANEGPGFFSVEATGLAPKTAKNPEQIKIFIENTAISNIQNNNNNNNQIIQIQPKNILEIIWNWLTDLFQWK